MKRYKLLKDLPTFKAGDEFELRDDGCLYWVDTEKGMHWNGHWAKEVMAYHHKTLEHFPNILEDWFEEIEEPKEFWTINTTFDCAEPIVAIEKIDKRYYGDEDAKSIGNYFETKEEAELAVRKLKAWKRLKDKGFKFEGIKEDYTRISQLQDPFRTGKRYLQFNKSEDEDWMKENWEDLDLLFSQEDG